MELQFYVLDSNFSVLGIIDIYKSAIWTERFYVSGDFELYVPNTDAYYDLLQVQENGENRYLMREDDHSKLGLLETVKYTHDVDSGDMILASGHTDDYILHSRVFYEQTTLVGGLEQAVRYMVRNSLIHDDLGQSQRNVSNMNLGNVVGLAGDVNVQYFGQYLDEEIEKLTKAYSFGYRMDFDYDTKQLTFNLLKSTDRSLDQSVNDPVVFSASLDNLTQSEFVQGIYPNLAYAIGYGSGVERYVGIYHSGTTPSGLNRKEHYVDGKDISDNGTALNALTYMSLLTSQAKDALDICKNGSEAVTGSVIPDMTYKLGVDYFLGDIVQIIVMVGTDRKMKKSLKQRVVEIIECCDENGYSCIPTFETVES